MLDKYKRALIAINKTEEVCLISKMANRHGLITGATGTGKTVTLQNLTETFSKMGVPVFAADIKGDLSGVSKIGGNKESVIKRVKEYGLEEKGFNFESFPVQFWDVFGQQGIPIRATITDMGPLLLTRILSLNDTQSGILSIIFKIAKDESLALIDLKDLQKILEYVGNNLKKFTTNYGNISTASIGAIQRGLLQLEQDGADSFFGEPDLNLQDLMQISEEKGVINILAADKLMNSPKVYSTFLVWMMNKLFEILPEVGDLEKPKLVFFFDEAHLLFNDSPKALTDKVEQVVRLIRSKGVGIYFVTQSPSDIPDAILAQLGNRIQHALRAYTPKDQKALKAAAQSFRANPKFVTEKAISELETGEALISFLDEKGAPKIVEKAYILPPQSQIGPISSDERNSITTNSIQYQRYSQQLNRESAYEILSDRLNRAQDEKDAVTQAKADEKNRLEEEKNRKAQERANQQSSKQRSKFWSVFVTAVVLPIIKQVMNSILGKNKNSRSNNTNRRKK